MLRNVTLVQTVDSMLDEFHILNQVLTILGQPDTQIKLF